VTRDGPVLSLEVTGSLESSVPWGGCFYSLILSVFATDGLTTFRRPVPSPPKPARQPGRTTFCRPPPSPVVPRRPPPSSAVFRRPLPSPTVPGGPISYVPSPGRSCLRSWGSSSLLMTAVLGIQGRGRTTFCRPVSSEGLSSPPTGPYGAPGRLRTLYVY